MSIICSKIAVRIASYYVCQGSEKTVSICCNNFISLCACQEVLDSVAILGGFLRFPETSQNWAGARARASS